jgi:anti-sigma regulatory factor (Ser/Thr protein kinase)
MHTLRISESRKRTAPSCHDGCDTATARSSAGITNIPSIERSSVMPKTEPWEYSLYIPNDLRAVTVRRRTVRLILTMHSLIRLADTAEFLATELVANAVCHTKGPAALRLRWRGGVLRIGAWDADPEPPETPSELGDLVDAEEGRGLALVRACADVWGWQPLASNGNRGKCVWCEIAAV